MAYGFGVASLADRRITDALWPPNAENCDKNVARFPSWPGPELDILM